MPRTHNLSFRRESLFHKVFGFFTPDTASQESYRNRYNAEIVKAKITSYFKENSITVDIGEIDRYKNPLSFFTAIDKLIEAKIFTPEKFNLLEAMDRDKPKAIESFNEILYLLRKNDLLNDAGFNMTYKKIDGLPSKEIFILESVIFDLENKKLLDPSAIAYLHVCEIDQFLIFSLISQKWLKDDIDGVKQLFTIEPSKLKSLFGSAILTNIGEVREILEKNKTDQPAIRPIFAPSLKY